MKRMRWAVWCHGRFGSGEGLSDNLATENAAVTGGRSRRCGICYKAILAFGAQSEQFGQLIDKFARGQFFSHGLGLSSGNRCRQRTAISLRSTRQP